MRNISDLLTQLQGFGGTDDDGQKPHSSPETQLEVNKTESERAKESRETQAQQMFDRYDFTPFRRQGVHMYESYKQGVQYMQSIFYNFFNLKQYNIDQRQWTDTNGKVHDNGLFYLLQKMGLQMVRSTANGWHMLGAGNFDSRTSEDICVNWFKRLHEFGLDIAGHLRSLNQILKPHEMEILQLIWTQIQNFMNLFHYHYQPPTNFVKRQAVWVYRED
jgi:hypothetical protein